MAISKYYAEYNRRYDILWEAVSEGLSAEKAGFNVIKQGEYVGNQTPTMRQQGDQFGHQFFDQDQKGQGHRPSYPCPRPKQRDDLEMGIGRSFKPRPC